MASCNVLLINWSQRCNESRVRADDSARKRRRDVKIWTLHSEKLSNELPVTLCGACNHFGCSRSALGEWICFLFYINLKHCSHQLHLSGSNLYL